MVNGRREYFTEGQSVIQDGGNRSCLDWIWRSIASDREDWRNLVEETKVKSSKNVDLCSYLVERSVLCGYEGVGTMTLRGTLLIAKGRLLEHHVGDSMALTPSGNVFVSLNQSTRPSFWRASLILFLGTSLSILCNKLGFLWIPRGNFAQENFKNCMLSNQWT